MTTTILLLEEVIDYDFQEYLVSVNRAVLIICVFFAYCILLKIFLTYQKQIDEAAENR